MLANRAGLLTRLHAVEREAGGTADAARRVAFARERFGGKP